MLGSQEMVLPDLVDPVRGWRSWNVETSYGKAVLTSPDQGTIWPARHKAEALCTHRRGGCHCGFNTFFDEDQLLSSRYAARPVWGEVSLWGEVRKFSYGWRAQYAYPSKLHVAPWVKGADRIARELSETYGVECTVKGPARRPMGVVDASVDATSVAAAVACAIVMLLSMFGAISYGPDLIAALRPLGGEGAPYPGWFANMLLHTSMVAIPAAALWTAVCALQHRRGQGGLFALGMMTIVFFAAITATITSDISEPSPSWRIHDRLDPGEALSDAHPEMVQPGNKAFIQAKNERDPEWRYRFRELSNGECMKEKSLWMDRKLCRKDDVIVVTAIGDPLDV